MNSNACIIFDIDGVLIDTRKSYNKTIKKTVEYLVKYIDPTVENGRALVSDELIFKFRKSGMFNNDTDTSYAFILGILCGPSKFSDLHFFIEYITENATAKGITSVENYISAYSESDLKKIKKLINYPGNIHNSVLTRVFDEYFYGPSLFKKQHNTIPKYYFGKPLIQNDKILMSHSTIEKILDFFDKRVGIVSGRSRLAAEYSTEDLFMVQRAKKVSNINIELIGVCASNVRSNQVRNLFKSNGTSLIVRDVNELPNILNKVMTQF